MVLIGGGSARRKRRAPCQPSPTDGSGKKQGIASVYPQAIRRCIPAQLVGSGRLIGWARHKASGDGTERTERTLLPLIDVLHVGVERGTDVVRVREPILVLLLPPPVRNQPTKELRTPPRQSVPVPRCWEWKSGNYLVVDHRLVVLLIIVVVVFHDIIVPVAARLAPGVAPARYFALSVTKSAL